MPLKRPVHILLSYDEETTCLGVMDVIARMGVDLPRPGAVIVGEPTLMQWRMRTRASAASSRP